MNDDVARLFELAGREVRPGFKHELRELLVEVDENAVVDLVASDEMTFVPDEPPSPLRHRWHRVFLQAAAAIGLVAGLVLVTQRGTDRASDAPGASSECFAAASELGVVRSASGVVRVGLMPDGHSFCLVAADGSALGAEPGTDLLVNDRTSTAAPAAPVIVDQGVVDQGVVGESLHWYVVAVPDDMPVAYVADNDRLSSFATRVGRELLVFDDDRPATGASADRAEQWNLYSSTGVVLSTLAVEVRPNTSAPASTDAAGSTDGAP